MPLKLPAMLWENYTSDKPDKKPGHNQSHDDPWCATGLILACFHFFCKKKSDNNE